MSGWAFASTWSPWSARQSEQDADDILRSRCVPGLWLGTAALWRLDQACGITVLQRGLASPEHAAFVARLAGQSG